MRACCVCVEPRETYHVWQVPQAGGMRVCVRACVEQRDGRWQRGSSGAVLVGALVVVVARIGPVVVTAVEAGRRGLVLVVVRVLARVGLDETSAAGPGSELTPDAGGSMRRAMAAVSSRNATSAPRTAAGSLWSMLPARKWVVMD